LSWQGLNSIRFGRKTNKITKFSILDEKQNSQFWTKFGQIILTKLNATGDFGQTKNDILDKIFRMLVAQITDVEISKY